MYSHPQGYGPRGSHMSNHGFGPMPPGANPQMMMRGSFASMGGPAANGAQFFTMSQQQPQQWGSMNAPSYGGGSSRTSNGQQSARSIGSGQEPQQQQLRSQHRMNDANAPTGIARNASSYGAVQSYGSMYNGDNMVDDSISDATNHKKGNSQKDDSPEAGGGGGGHNAGAFSNFDLLVYDDENLEVETPSTAVLPSEQKGAKQKESNSGSARGKGDNARKTASIKDDDGDGIFTSSQVYRRGAGEKGSFIAKIGRRILPSSNHSTSGQDNMPGSATNPSLKAGGGGGSSRKAGGSFRRTTSTASLTASTTGPGNGVNAVPPPELSSTQRNMSVFGVNQDYVKTDNKYRHRGGGRASHRAAPSVTRKSDLKEKKKRSNSGTTGEGSAGDILAYDTQSESAGYFVGVEPSGSGGNYGVSNSNYLSGPGGNYPYFGNGMVPMGMMPPGYMSGAGGPMMPMPYGPNGGFPFGNVGPYGGMQNQRGGAPTQMQQAGFGGSRPTSSQCQVGSNGLVVMDISGASLADDTSAAMVPLIGTEDDDEPGESAEGGDFTLIKRRGMRIKPLNPNLIAWGYIDD